MTATDDNPTGIGLARMVLGSPPFLPISDQRAADLADAMKTAWEHAEVEQKLDLVIANYLEHEREMLSRVLSESIQRLQSSNDFFDMRLAFNRRVLNLLTSTRLYTDQLVHHARLILGAGPTGVDMVKAWISEEYDADIAFRTMEALRNFAQHRSLPLQGMTLHSDWVSDKGEDFLTSNVSLNILCNQLEGDGGLKRSVLVELKSIGNQIDIKGYIRRYIESIGRIHMKFREAIDAKIENSKELLERAFQDYLENFPEENSIVGLAVVEVKKWPYRSPVTQLIRDPFEYGDALRKRNSSLQNLSRRIAEHRVH